MTGGVLRRIALLLVTCGNFAFAAHAAERDLRFGKLAVTVWEPAAPPPGARPVVIFSHGFHGCATQSRFLMRAFAEAGDVVFAPNHADAVCHGGAARLLDPPTAPFHRPAAWTDASYRDRRDDIFSLVAALRADPAWRDRLDFSRLALVGHSLGGYTVLGLAGAWPSWRLPGVRAVIALSPYAQPFIAARSLAGLAAPVMYQGGTLDFGLTPAVDKVGGAYALSPAPKYFVNLRGATHYAWTDIGISSRAAIVAYARAFLAQAFGGAPDPLLHTRMDGVADLRFQDR